jgi:hypothetical protein
MEASVITALAAAGASIMGAAASVSVTWINQQKQTVRELTQVKLRERETLYGEFITEASRLAVDAVSHSLETLEKLVNLYGIIGRIRLLASEDILTEAEMCCQRIVELYSAPNLNVEQVDGSFDLKKLDPIKRFSSACRAELMRVAGSL